MLIYTLLKCSFINKSWRRGRMVLQGDYGAAWGCRKSQASWISHVNPTACFPLFQWISVFVYCHGSFI